LAGALWHKKDHLRAIAECNEAIRLKPDYAEAWRQRAIEYRELRQWDKALADWNNVLRFDPTVAADWGQRGWAYLCLRQYDKAIADYTMAIQLDPKYPVAWRDRGVAYGKLGQWDKAFADHDKAIELDPNGADTWNNRGVTFEDRQQWDKAIADFSEAIERDPKYAVAWSNRGWAYASLRQWDKALADLSKAIEINPDAPPSWYYRALVRLQCDDPAGYRKDCADMRRQFGPSAKPDDVNWTVWTCIQLADGVDDWTKLVEWGEKALAADPDNDIRLTTLGAVLYRAGRFDEAVRRLTEAEAAFKKAKVRVSMIAYAWLFRAMAEERLGHAEQAREWLARAVREIEQPPVERAPGVDTWNRRLAPRLLRSEAEKLLKFDPQQGKKKP
jgi:tetratricopeptide (TPR) repeat protein